MNVDTRVPPDLDDPPMDSLSSPIVSSVVPELVLAAPCALPGRDGPVVRRPC